MPSAVISRYHYNDAQLTLTIVYVSGAVYRYLEVPRQVFENFKAAFSKGTFLNKEIKGKFDFERVS